MATEEYRVKLDAFEGPLDLLLFLIRKDQLDIHDIPIARITDQYLGYLAQLHTNARLDIDEAGEFLVMAAMLTEIKSRMLMPKPALVQDHEQATPGTVEDPRAELVRQLLEYKKYRDAADALESRADTWSKRFGTARAGIDADAVKEVLALDQHTLDMDDLSLVDLVEAFKKIVETVNFDKLGEHHVTFDDTPIELHAADILARLADPASSPRTDPATGRQDGELELRDFLVKRTRSEMVGLFLALLELVRNGRVGVRQDRSAGKDSPIFIRALAPTPGEIPNSG